MRTIKHTNVRFVLGEERKRKEELMTGSFSKFMKGLEKAKLLSQEAQQVLSKMS